MRKHFFAFMALFLFTLSAFAQSDCDDCIVADNAFVQYFGNPSCDEPVSFGVAGQVHLAEGCTNPGWYIWDFGDGSPDDWSQSNFNNHQYQTDGNYTVTVSIRIVVGNEMCEYQLSNSTIVQISGCEPVQDECVCDLAGILTEGGSNCTAIGFGLSANACNVDANAGYFWDFGEGDGPGPGGEDTEHTYSEDGEYTVTVYYTIMNPDGTSCAANTSITITVLGCSSMDDCGCVLEDNSLWEVSENPICNQVLEFNVNPTIELGPGCSESGLYLWNFGDESDAFWTLDPFTTHEFEEAGTYNVTMTYAINGFDCAYETPYTVVIGECADCSCLDAPGLELVPLNTPSCGFVSFLIQDESGLGLYCPGAEPNFSVEWDFGNDYIYDNDNVVTNGSTGAQAYYTENGEYHVTAIVSINNSDGSTCQREFEEDVIIMDCSQNGVLVTGTTTGQGTSTGDGTDGTTGGINDGTNTNVHEDDTDGGSSGDGGGRGKNDGENFALVNNISIHPSVLQVGGSVYVNYTAEKNEVLRISAFSINGQLISSADYPVEIGQNRLEIESVFIKTGNFLLSISNESEQLSTEKIVVTK